MKTKTPATTVGHGGGDNLRATTKLEKSPGPNLFISRAKEKQGFASMNLGRTPEKGTRLIE